MDLAPRTFKSITTPLTSCFQSSKTCQTSDLKNYIIFDIVIAELSLH